MLKKDATHKIVFWGVLITFVVIYSLISIVNHYNLRTNALDLGMFNHAIYNFSHLKSNAFTLSVHGNELNYFGDHFSPITAFLSPLYHLFGSYTLLIVQIFSILFGGVGIYKIAQHKLKSNWLSLLVMLHFFCIWAITSALSFDFHTNVIGAMLVPWLLYYWMKNQFSNALIVLVVIWICKENMALFTAFIALGLWIGGKALNPSKNWKFDGLLCLSSLLYFVIVMKVIMPAFQGDSEITQLAKYGYMGNSLGEIILYLFENPSYIITSLFDGSWGNNDFTAVKLETHFMILASGGLLFFLSPQLLIMLIPIYYQKFLAADNMVWSIGLHYNIEFVPIISVALILFLLKIRKTNLQIGIAMVFFITTTLLSFVKLNNREVPYYSFQKPKENIFKIEHYITDYDVKEIKSILKSIPNDVNVSTNNLFAPRLEKREKIFFFPYIKDAVYIILDKHKHGHYPLSDEDFEIKHEELKQNKLYTLKLETKDLWLYEKTGYAYQ